MQLVRTSIVFRESVKYPLPQFESRGPRHLSCAHLMLNALRENPNLTSYQIFNYVKNIKFLADESLASTLSSLVHQKRVVKEMYFCECCGVKAYKYRLGAKEK